MYAHFRDVGDEISNYIRQAVFRNCRFTRHGDYQPPVSQQCAAKIVDEATVQ